MQGTMFLQSFFINLILSSLCMTHYNSVMQIKIKKIMTIGTLKFVQVSLFIYE